MEQRFLIDSNVLIDYLAERIPPAKIHFVEQILEQQFIISVVSKIEVLGFDDLPNKMAAMEDFVAMAQIIPLDERITQRTIMLRRRFKKLKIGDAIIAATALEYNFVLLTRNVDDFKQIPDLRIENPHTVEV